MISIEFIRFISDICIKRWLKELILNYNFEWNSDKAKSNKRKHRLGFEVAATVFKDPQALSVFDTEHSEDEERWITMGIASSGNLVVVVHTYKEENDNSVIIRIISARKATKNETKQY